MEYIEIDGQEIPVKTYQERRRDVRFSITRTGAFLRVPQRISRLEMSKQQKKFEHWLRKTIEQKPEILDRFRGRIYEDGMTLTVGQNTYTIKITTADTKSHTAKIRDKTIYIQLGVNDKGHHLQKSIRQLVSRCVASDNLPRTIERVRYWNDRHFNRPIKNIRFKLNQSNWGSCSTQGNINFSTRLLFAPQVVIDYVIVHELAHLLEHNHSPRFWAIVQKVMPDFKEQERWLREHGEACNF